jgi:PAS domain S-box-containing protein
MMQLSLRQRLRLGLMILAALLALVSIAAVASLNRLGSAVATLLRENYVSVVACEQMKEALERQDSAAIFAAAGRDEVAGPILTAQRPTFHKAFEVEAANITLPGEGELVETVRRDYDVYLREVDRVLSLPAGHRLDPYFRELLPRFDALRSTLTRIQRMNHENMQAADRDAKALAHSTVNIAVAIAAAAVLFAAWFSWWLPQTLTKPVEDFSAAARAIGEGNLDVAVPAVPVQELEPLAAAFARMLEKLRVYRASSLGELLAAKDLANSTVACMLDPVIVFGTAGEVLLANEAAERVFGIQPGAAEELRALEIHVPEPLAIARDAVLSRKEAVLPKTLAEAMRWDRGGERYLLVRAAPLFGGEGETTGVVLLAQDVTRYRRIDELKSDVVATVSHQFKTPLTSLRMATHMLLDPAVGSLTEPQRELATAARDETERLRAMVDELLDLVRIESEAGALHRRTIDAAALLGEVAEAHRAVAKEKEIALEVFPGEGVGFEGDAERLSIVLANLVTNAIRHTAGGGRVTLTAARVGDQVHLIVADTGEGIDAGDLARIFERSVTIGAGPTRDRHGLGLAIAREIVLHHGGDILVESAPGKGSQFTVVLPGATPAG